MPHDDLYRAEEALTFINPDDREVWVRMGMAMKSEFGETGFDAWDRWSAFGDDYDPNAAKSVWKSIKEGGKVTISSLFYLAKEKGWTDKSGRKQITKEELQARQAEREARLAAAAAKEAEQREAARLRAVALWEAAEPADDGHPYLERKGVRAHGLRVGKWEIITEDGEIVTVSSKALLVPICDRKRQVHSLQAIFPGKLNNGRDKDYLADGAKSGNFHVIGKPKRTEDDKAVFVLCEGYATGASIHEATGHCVLVCFDRTNLVTVSVSLRERSADAVIVIAADNDQWTKGNPGVTSATKATVAVGGLLAIPPFSEADADGDDPTDYNDLARMRGLDAVRESIEAAIAGTPMIDVPEVPSEQTEQPLPWEGERQDSPPPDEAEERTLPEQNGYFTILGYNRSTYYIFQHGKRQIAEISKGDLSDIGLIELAPMYWWEANYPKPKGGIDNKAAAEFIIRTAEKRGIYDPSRVRGRGAWIDEGRFVFHHGHYLSVDGVEMPVTEIRSSYVYEQDRSMPIAAADPLSDAEGQNILQTAMLFRWKMPGSAALLAGWVALAPLCGAIKWRPHIWLSGGASCGKTTVINRYVHQLLDGVDVFAQGDSTEAGIRQTLRADARPVLIDESESNEERDARRIQGVLTMIRQASSDSDAKTLKGTVSGDAVQYHVRSMFCLASIQVGIKQTADIQRMCVLDLKSKKTDPNPDQTWETISAALYEIERDDALPGKLFRRMLNLMPTVLENIKVFVKVAGTRFRNQRDGDQYGTLLAGAWSLISTAVATPEQALALIERYDWDEMRDGNDSDESQKALQALMEAKIRAKGGLEVSVYELLRATQGHASALLDIQADSADAILQQNGMIVKSGYLLMSNTSPALRKLFAGTTFEADWRGSLLRLDGADKNNNKAERFNGVPSKCIRVAITPLMDAPKAHSYVPSYDEPEF